MLRSLIIGADEELTRKLEALFTETGQFQLLRSVAEYPDEHGLERMLRAHAPRVVFLCVNHLERAFRVKSDVESTVPGLPVVAFGADFSQQMLLELMKMGIREFLPMPFQPNNALDLSDRLREHLEKNPLFVPSTDLMFSFLPAKPGVGTSTLALNISVALSRTPGSRVLLTDFDLNSGLVAFMLKMNSAYSVIDAVMRADDLDENLWPQLTTSVGDLDVLPCGRSEPGIRLHPSQIQRMLDYARRQYSVICADLSGNMEKYSIELMMESKRIFLVTTAEIPPLHLARSRLLFLRDLDLGDRVSVLLNRWTKRSSVTVAQVENLLEVPVYESFPNNYAGVHKALMEGRPIEEATDLGKRFAELAERIMAPDSQPKRKRKFLESFSILSPRYPVSR